MSQINPQSVEGPVSRIEGRLDSLATATDVHDAVNRLADRMDDGFNRVGNRVETVGSSLSEEIAGLDRTLGGIADSLSTIEGMLSVGMWAAGILVPVALGVRYVPELWRSVKSHGAGRSEELTGQGRPSRL